MRDLSITAGGTLRITTDEEQIWEWKGPDPITALTPMSEVREREQALTELYFEEDAVDVGGFLLSRTGL